MVHTATTDKKDEFGMTLIEALNPEVLKTVYGTDNVTGDNVATGITVSADSSELGEFVYVVEMIVTGGVLKRVVIPCGVISNVSEITYNDSDAVGYAITLTAQADSSGKTHYEYIAKPE